MGYGGCDMNTIFNRHADVQPRRNSRQAGSSTGRPSQGERTIWRASSTTFAGSGSELTAGTQAGPMIVQDIQSFATSQAIRNWIAATDGKPTVEFYADFGLS
jgi:hypothetical protein